ncbi:MAG TPA: hypothetical protein VIA06_18750 [Candidatus Dormibacteraeota bacterium]|nr:hypothetical protein [Candidatus Dormibacteraeota bacterium]
MESPYLTRFSRRDLELLAEVAGVGEPGGLPSDAQELERVLEQEELFTRLFGPEPEAALLQASPFLAFTVLLLRLIREIGMSRFISERVGSGQRLPVFDAEGPRAFLRSRERRIFLADLLGSYSRVASGSVWFRTSRGWRRRRYSDLDPLRLVELLDSVTGTQRLLVLRRLGDLCLFLSGVFPDYVAAHPLEPRHLARMARAVGATGAGDPGPSELVLAGGAGLWELDWVGRRAYRGATAGSPDPELLADLVRRFREARRVLDLLTRTYLFPGRGRWFGGMDGEGS